MILIGKNGPLPGHEKMGLTPIEKAEIAPLFSAYSYNLVFTFPNCKNMLASSSSSKMKLS
jgi:hypothetical protein